MPSEYDLRMEQLTGRVTPVTVTITAGQSQSSAADIRGRDLVGILTDSDWTSAAMTFLASYDGTNFHPHKHQTDGEITIASTDIATNAQNSIAIEPGQFLAPTHLKVRSGTSAAAVNQVSAQTIVLYVRVL